MFISTRYISPKNFANSKNKNKNGFYVQANRFTQFNHLGNNYGRVDSKLKSIDICNLKKMKTWLSFILYSFGISGG